LSHYGFNKQSKGDVAMKLTQKDYLLDDIKHFTLEANENSSPNCDVCGIYYSWKRITVKSSDYEATINCCEDCQANIERSDDNNRVKRFEIVCTDEIY